jgi:hypothetical protein
MAQHITENFFSFIVRYFQQKREELVLCVTGIVGFVIIGCGAPRSGIAAEKNPASGPGIREPESG